MAEATPMDKEEKITYHEEDRRIEADVGRKSLASGVRAMEGCGSRYRYILKSKDIRLEDWDRLTDSETQ